MLLSLRNGILALLLLGAHTTFAQTDTATGGDLEEMLNQAPASKGHAYTTATFKSTRVINGQSVETQGAGVLDFIILHRFGPVNDGAKNFFGLDNANTRIAFEYGITDWLTAGIGRSSFQKEYDGLARVKILRQTEDNHMPITLAYAGTIMVHTEDVNLGDSTTKYYFSNRVSYSNQILVARKFNNRFSLQFSPSHLHYNLVKKDSDPNDVFALGLGGRVKLTHRLAITAEYFYTIPGTNLGEDYHNSMSIGVDIETGGHVFQLQLSNSTGMSERAFIGQTTDSWFDNGNAKGGGIHLGFNIHRVFTIVKPKEFRG